MKITNPNRNSIVQIESRQSIFEYLPRQSIPDPDQLPILKNTTERALAGTQLTAEGLVQITPKEEFGVGLEIEYGSKSLIANSPLHADGSIGHTIATVQIGERVFPKINLQIEISNDSTLAKPVYCLEIVTAPCRNSIEKKALDSVLPLLDKILKKSSHLSVRELVQRYNTQLKMKLQMIPKTASTLPNSTLSTLTTNPNFYEQALAQELSKLVLQIHNSQGEVLIKQTSPACTGMVQTNIQINLNEIGQPDKLSKFISLGGKGARLHQAAVDMVQRYFAEQPANLKSLLSLSLYNTAIHVARRIALGEAEIREPNLLFRTSPEHIIFSALSDKEVKILAQLIHQNLTANKFIQLVKHIVKQLSTSAKTNTICYRIYSRLFSIINPSSVLNIRLQYGKLRVEQIKNAQMLTKNSLIRHSKLVTYRAMTITDVLPRQVWPTNNRQGIITTLRPECMLPIMINLQYGSAKLFTVAEIRKASAVCNSEAADGLLGENSRSLKSALYKAYFSMPYIN